MLVYAVDLGTTNTKVVVYDERLTRLGQAASVTPYSKHGVRVEFDPGEIFDLVVRLVAECAQSIDRSHLQHSVIAVTGQAESLVLADAHGDAVRPGMSWMDNRAQVQADEIADLVDQETAFAITGEPESTTTWPASKLRWLSQHEGESLRSAHSVLMIKDDVIARLTGHRVGEMTTRGFTYFYDVQKQDYWDQMLEVCGIDRSLLPALVPAGTDVGLVTEAVRAQLPQAASWRVNAGALDHFCAMVGTNSYRYDVVSESAGSVLSLSALPSAWTFDPAQKVSFHNGLRPGETLLFNGADSGGVVLEWYRQQCLGALPYPELEQALQQRSARDAPVFLPHLTGVNPPDYLPRAKGAFIDLQLHHDRIDMAYAVEEGIAHLLRRNIEYLQAGSPIREVVSTGGGSTSPFWTQLKADVCGVQVTVPAQAEATCRGAAVLALVASGHLGDLADSEALAAPTSRVYAPRHGAEHQRRYEAFEDALFRLYRD